MRLNSTAIRDIARVVYRTENNVTPDHQGGSIISQTKLFCETKESFAIPRNTRTKKALIDKPRESWQDAPIYLFSQQF